ncbi:TasA family protein [Neobacillus niacini]|uniref:TasA family protein n=1 Tax=Neobacillus niacini TaxID=86668 RepID=UPI00203CFDEB|nr:TasA family protein [Neobacillus niacini]MCM3692726.1 CalY family protein [Neobacillus niacini]
MSMKKKLGLGVASAALGLSLIGGGTWAAFNDTGAINNHFAAGTLDLGVVANSQTEPINFDLRNMKPGDSVERVFTLTNKGSLAIKEVLLSGSASGFVPGVGTNTDMNAFLDQFEIEFFKVERKTGETVGVFSGKTITLKQLVNESYDFNAVKDVYEATDGTKRINLAPLSNLLGSEGRGIPVTPVDTDDVHVKITFKNDTTKVDPSNPFSEYVQNKYQGNAVNFSFDLEATQWDGVEVLTNDENGTINNGVQNSADGTTQPDPRTNPGFTVPGGSIVED